MDLESQQQICCGEKEVGVRIYLFLLMIEFTEIVVRTLLNQNKTEYQYKQLLFTSALVDLHRHFEDVCNMITRKKHNAFFFCMIWFRSLQLFTILFITTIAIFVCLPSIPVTIVKQSRLNRLTFVLVLNLRAS